MLRRHLGPILALSAAGLMIGFSTASRADDPASVAADPASAPESVEILKARRAGDLDVVVRGQGEERVKFKIKNLSNRRLHVILPPGLVAASSVGQGGLAGGGGGGGFQSMGLGTPTTFAGSFGAFKGSSSESGFRSMPTTGPAKSEPGIDVAAGQSAEFSVPSVCLNFGINTPTPKDVFELMDVNDYTPDPRVRKALRSLATLGTSQLIAQAVMWHISNGMSFPQLGDQTVRRFSAQDLTLAARFVQAVDGSGSSELVELSHLGQARIQVRLAGDGAFAKDTVRLASELQNRRLLGLPIQILDADDSIEPALGTLRLDVRLGSGTKKGSSKARVAVRFAPIGGGWVVLGNVIAPIDGEPGNLEGSTLLNSLDHAIAAEFVDTKIARRIPGRTTLEVRNRLPFTLSNVTLRAGRAVDAPLTPYFGVGVGPTRSTLLPIEAGFGVVDRVELNGL